MIQQDPDWTATDRGTFERSTPEDDRPVTDAFDELLRHLGELREYFSYYLSARADGVKMGLRRIGLLAAMGIMGFVAGAALIVTTIVLLLRGMAGGLGRLFGGMQWLGELVTGVFFLIVLTWGLYFAWSRTTTSWRKATVKKYDQRKNWQREQFGRDVHEQAEQARR